MTDPKNTAGVALKHLDLAEQIIAALQESVPAMDAYGEDEIAALEVEIASIALPFTHTPASGAVEDDVERLCAAMQDGVGCTPWHHPSWDRDGGASREGVREAVKRILAALTSEPQPSGKAGELGEGPKAGEAVCPGCEGRPAPDNNPCAVCGLREPQPLQGGEVTREALDAIIREAVESDDPKATYRFFLPEDSYGDRARAVSKILALLSAGRGGEGVRAMRCQTCHAPRAKAPCHKCGGELTPAADGWEEPELPPIDRIRELAREVGYGLGVHGSLGRDLDLIAVPWIEDAASPTELADHIAKGLPGRIAATFDAAPHGRLGFNIKPEGWFKMIDLSVIGPLSLPAGGEDEARPSSEEVTDLARKLFAEQRPGTAWDGHGVNRSYWRRKAREQISAARKGG